MASIQPINTNKQIREHNRNTQVQFDISKWFAEETLTITFGDEEGRPSKNVTMRKEYIIQFINNGWRIESISGVSEDGNWSQTSHSETTQSSHTTESSSSESATTSSTSGSSTTTTAAETDGTTSGSPYWYAAETIKFIRRRLQPENVLESICDMFTARYNEGVANEDARYNELVTLYGIMLSRNETEGNAIISSALDVTGLFDRMYGAINLSVTAANNRAMRFGRYSVDGAVAEIKIKYENLIAKTRSEMVGNGTYNGTVWPTVEAGIKRQMEVAMAEATREGYKDAIDADVKVLSAKGDVMAQLVNAKNNIAAAIDQRKVTAIELRNTALQAMLNFMASREDLYPQLQEISQVASQIGFSVGATGNFI